MNANTHVVCGQCQTVVRVPTDKLAQQPHCPKCHQLLFNGHPVTLNAAAFEAQLKRSDLPVVVEEPNLAANLNIRSIPTLLVFRQGREIARQAGAMDTANLTRWLEGVLAA